MVMSGELVCIDIINNSGSTPHINIPWTQSSRISFLIRSAGPAVSSLQLENVRLRDELDRLKRKMPSVDSMFRRTNSNVGGGVQQQQALESLAAQLAQVGLG